jgi:hypothetical protein
MNIIKLDDRADLWENLQKSVTFHQDISIQNEDILKLKKTALDRENTINKRSEQKVDELKLLADEIGFTPAAIKTQEIYSNIIKFKYILISIEEKMHNEKKEILKKYKTLLTKIQLESFEDIKEIEELGRLSKEINSDPSILDIRAYQMYNAIVEGLNAQISKVPDQAIDLKTPTPEIVEKAMNYVRMSKELQNVATDDESKLMEQYTKEMVEKINQLQADNETYSKILNEIPDCYQEITQYIGRLKFIHK